MGDPLSGRLSLASALSLAPLGRTTRREQHRFPQGGVEQVLCVVAMAVLRESEVHSNWRMV